VDTLTQIALGTAISEAFFRKSLGRKSILFGALCGWFPDIDVFFHNPQSWEGLEAHRGITHSLIFLPLIAPILGEVGYRWGKKGSRITWIYLAFWALITHPLLDVCTSYGTQLLAPISNQRFSTNAIAIIDILYSFPLFICCYFALSKKVLRNKSRSISQLALGASSMYLLCCHLISYTCLARGEALFRSQGFQIEKIRSSPPLFFPLMRRIVAKDSKGNLITTSVSIVSENTSKIQHQKMPRSQIILDTLQTEEGRIFQWFADDFLLIKEQEKQLIFIDARYGMHNNPWWSPFSATIQLQNGQTIGELTRQSRDSNVDYSLEFRTGWNTMWGIHPPQGTDSM
jgi:inner membrane protein